ncbi:MAG: hypothetical protein E3J71_04445 [Candidatus Stahlbacteria bacterium]|nr:MAG: hypothetical protein E3J71_04445 [Candidatus Stahlbacteria bacterium]
MKNVFKQITILCLIVLAGSVIFCKKKAEEEPEPHWLRVYHDGEFKWKIDVSEWEVREDVVPLGVFFYPWQGEDSINWTEYDPHGHPLWPGPYLAVNDKVVGVNLGFIPLSYPEIVDSEKIITATFDEYFVGSEFDPAVLKKLPNLIGLYWCVGSREDLERIGTIPSHLRIYLFCYHDITGADLKGLSKFSNIRSLRIEDGSLSYRDLRYLCRFKGLRWFEFITRVHQEERIKCLSKLKKLRYWYVGPIII